MKRLAEVVGHTLTWAQPSALRMEYELRVGEEVAATLRFRSSFGSFATGQSADGSWTFKRVGFLQTRVTIRESGGDAEIGTFRNQTWAGGGTLELPDGRQFLATTNIWQTKLEFQAEGGVPLIRFKSRGLVHLSADVEVESQAIQISELRWMVLFGWYLTVMMHMDSGTAAAM